mgnify:CR=1 FL=1
MQFQARHPDAVRRADLELRPLGRRTPVGLRRSTPGSAGRRQAPQRGHPARRTPRESHAHGGRARHGHRGRAAGATTTRSTNHDLDAARQAPSRCPVPDRPRRSPERRLPRRGPQSGHRLAPRRRALATARLERACRLATAPQDSRARSTASASSRGERTASRRASERDAPAPRVPAKRPGRRDPGRDHGAGSTRSVAAGPEPGIELDRSAGSASRQLWPSRRSRHLEAELIQWKHSASSGVDGSARLLVGERHVGLAQRSGGAGAQQELLATRPVQSVLSRANAIPPGREMASCLRPELPQRFASPLRARTSAWIAPPGLVEAGERFPLAPCAVQIAPR